ncbi:hypothetical protein [Pelovirga terrestris]|uniref:Uncharacterized protein n=1 Tax=Pelovirga terrestris TaxID=2771352 RepID=A0A8J6UIU6_9BACT|nr:hypothetical protein [Pelovirga terrestris]MBD1401760.1 hypothetical protein [Pelovirga terrestris]
MSQQGAYATGRAVYLVDGLRTPFIKEAQEVEQANAARAEVIRVDDFPSATLRQGGDQ